jgi:acyl-CoA thioesterase
MTLAEAVVLATSPAGETTWQVPDGWQQGRGAFGGLTLAALAKAASTKLFSTDRPLRTLTAELPGAVVTGPADVLVGPIRDGHALSTIAARLAQNDGVVAHAVFNFGKTRDVAFERAPLGPTVPPFADARVCALGSVGPTFTQHFEYRIVRGTPLSGAEDAVTEGWVRLRDPGDVPPWIALITMVDAWFPSVLPVFTSARPFGTISFAAHLFDRAWLSHEPLFHRSRLMGSQQGYFVELRELFTPSGELCAINQQTMAISSSPSAMTRTLASQNRSGAALPVLSKWAQGRDVAI